MKFHNRLICTLFIVTTSIVTFITGQDVCSKKSSCICEFSNGTGIDLTPSSRSSFYTVQNFHVKDNGNQFELSTFFYHPCYDASAPVNTTDINVTNTCKEPLSICRHVNTMNIFNTTERTYQMDNGSYDFLGSTNVSQFSNDGKSLIYFNGPSTTTVLLICSQGESELHVSSLEEPNKMVLSFYSRDACLKQIEIPGRSVGSTLLIIFFCCVIFYIVLGVCTKKFLMGATGIEVIPNLAFWSDLPNLVKEGWAFTISGFKLPTRGAPPANPNPNGYDSI